MIRDYLRAKVVKLLSRVILLVNGAIDAIYIMCNGAIEKKRERVTFLSLIHI